MNIFNKLNTMYLTENEQLLVDFIKYNTNDFIDLSANDIASQCYISVSTIYRLCHKLELSGLSQLKVQVLSSLDEFKKETDDFDYNFPIKQNETQYQIVHKLQDVYNQTVTSTLNLLDLEELSLSASLLKKSKTIDIYTLAGNIYFAENFKFQMQEIGVQIHVPLEDYQQNLNATISDSTHVAIVISFGGRGSSVSKITKLLKYNKTPIILITSTLDNPLVKYADHVLYMSSYEDHYHKISSFSTRLSLLYILDIIYTCFFELDYEKNLKKKLDYYSKMTLISNER